MGTRKAGRITTFVKELGIQFFAQIPVVDKTMDSIEKAVSRRKRIERFANGKAFKESSVGGEIGVQMDR